MIELFINGPQDFEKADLFEDTIFSLNKQFTDLQDLTTITVDYTKTVELPRTAKNDLLFNGSFRFDRQQFSIDTSKRISCRFVSNNDILMEGYCILNTVDDEKYTITIYGQLGRLFKKFFEIPFDEVVQPMELNAETVARSFQSGPLQYNPELVNYVIFDQPILFPITMDHNSVLTIYGENLSLVSGITTIGNPPAQSNFSIYSIGNKTLVRPFIKSSVQSQEHRKFSTSFNQLQFKIMTEGADHSYQLNIDGYPRDFIVKSTASDITPARLVLPYGKYTRIRLKTKDATWDFLPYYDGTFKLRDANSGLTIQADDGELDPNTTLQTIGFCSTHQGQYAEFDSTRTTDRELPMDAYNERYSGLTEHTLKEFRSYYQQPYLYLKPLFLKLQEYINNSSDFEGYKLQYDGGWFNEFNPYWNRLIMMGRTFNDRDDIHEDGPENPFMFNPEFLGQKGGCITDFSDSKKMTFKNPPQDFNIINNATIEKLPDTKLLKGNIAPVWFCNLKESRKNVTHNRYKTTMHLAVSITNPIGLKWWGGIEQPHTNGLFYAGDVYLSWTNCFIVSINSGSHTDYYGFYTPISDNKPELLRPDQEDFFKQNGVSKLYPLTTNNETYFDEDENRITFLWDLGIGDSGWVSTTDTSFTYSIKMNGPLRALRPNNMQTGDFLNNITALVYDCVDYAGIPLGDFPIDGTEESNGFEGNVFYSDYDSRRSHSTIGLTEVLAEEETIMGLLIKYAKMFRLYFDVDYYNKTITLRDNYFDNYKVEDWTHKVDYSSIKINPVAANDEAITMGYRESDMKYNALYKYKTAVYYGDGKLMTDIDTLNTTKQLFEEQITSCTSQEYYPTWGANTYRNALSKEICPTAITAEKDATEANKVSIYGGYYFINDVQPITAFFDFASGQPPTKEYIISDDTYEEIANNEYCWRLRGVRASSDRFPYVDFRTTEGDYNWGCVWVEPRKTFTDKKYEGAFYLNALWQNFLYEVYNPNNKLVTADILLTETDYNLFRFNTLVTIDNTLYLVNKIQNFTGEGLTKVELLQIYDPTNLMSQFTYIKENGSIRNSENQLTIDPGRSIKRI